MSYATDMKEMKAILRDNWKNKKEPITMEEVFQWMKFGYIAGCKSEGMK